VAISLTPTYSGRWGPRQADLFDFYANATRDAGGNPLLIYRHGTGTGSTYLDDKIIDREPANLTDFLTNPTTAASLGLHFDVMFIETPQRTVGSAVASGDRVLMMSAVREFQRAIAEVKRLGVIGFGSSNQYKTNPQRVGAHGFSWGASLTLLTQLFPTYQGDGAGRTHSQAQYRGAAFDSSLRFVIYNAGQPDIRNISGTDQIHYSTTSPYLGTCTTSSTEWDAIPSTLKDTLSCLAYFGNGDVPACPPTAVLYNIAGDHVHPYGSGVGGSDIHDSQQGVDLAAALQSAGIRYISRQYVVTDATSGWQNGTAGKLTNCQAVYDFIASAVTAVV